jgi:hypothetical protein
MVRVRRPFVSAAAAAAAALLAAGCGGGESSGVASVGATTAAVTARTGTTAERAGTLASAFAFARCMRSHGVAGWPDPTSRGVFDKSTLRQLGISPSRVRAIEERFCNIPLPSPEGYTVTAADRADYLRAAACMRSHGFLDFPDPTFENDDVRTDIPASIDQDSPQFRSAASICTRLIPAGLPYSKPSGS